MYILRMVGAVLFAVISFALLALGLDQGKTTRQPSLGFVFVCCIASMVAHDE